MVGSEVWERWAQSPGEVRAWPGGLKGKSGLCWPAENGKGAAPACTRQGFTLSVPMQQGGWKLLWSSSPGKRRPQISEPRPASLGTHPGGGGEWELGRGWRRGEREPLCTGAPLWQPSWLQASMPVAPHGEGGCLCVERTESGRRRTAVSPQAGEREGGKEGVSPTSTDLQQIANSVRNTMTALKEKKRNSS